MTDKPKPEIEPEAKDGPDPIPALFATIHFRSAERPNGYTDDEIAKLNQTANLHRLGKPE